MKILSILLLSFFIVGCGGMPIPDETDLEMKSVVGNTTESFENQEPAITRVKTKALVVSKPKDFPERLKGKTIKLNLSRSATLEDLAEILEVYGLNLVIGTELNSRSFSNNVIDVDINTESKDDKDEEVKESSNISSNSPLIVRKFEGTLEEYLVLLSELYDISFNYKGNQIVVMQKFSDYIINLPQFPEGEDKTITNEILDTVESLGAQSIKHSLISGMVNYQATPFSQRKIYEYLRKTTKSVSVISLQAAIVTVKVDSQKTKGFDWSKMNLNFAKDLAGLLEVPTTMISKDTFDSMGSNLSDMQGGAQLGKAGMGFSVAKKDFSFSSVINFLNTYGKTETNQSVLMRTLSGKKVVLNSGQKIPYVSNLSSTANDSSISSGVQTEIQETGIVLDILPYFDNDNEIVTANVNLTIDSILGYIELSAGNEIGSLSQPNVQSQEFQSVIRLGAGETTVIGGIMFDSVEDKRTGNAYLGDSNVSAKDLKIEKNAVFILLRPTVKIFSEDF